MISKKSENSFIPSDFGFDDFFQSEQRKMSGCMYPVARVMAEYKEAYRVISSTGEYIARVTGKHIYTAYRREDYPAVGDWVTIEPFADDTAVIRAIFPRKTVLKRKQSNTAENQIIAVNIDYACIVASMDRDYNLNRFERYIVICQEGGITPVLVLNKIDLLTVHELDSRQVEIRQRFGSVVVFSTSLVTQKGIDELQSFISQGKTYCFLGSSGVGKSSIINVLLGRDLIKTEEISEYFQRGKHTTTTREIYFLHNGASIIDNPGIREVGIAGSQESIGEVFDDITAIAGGCRYADCTHIHEPGCAVQSALKNGMLDSGKYENYVHLRKESDFFELTELEKKEKNRKFGKFVKNAKKEIDSFH